jgi:acetyl-CoA carboxylase biotin carboxyl carrier protein
VALTYQEVADILKVIDASECDEVILEIGGTRLVVRRKLPNGPHHESSAPSQTPPIASAASASATLPTSPTPAMARSIPAMPDSPDQNLLDVRAPMVGTFYRRPSPQEPPFVEVGQTVTKGQPLCLIEVMKLFTTVEANEAGTIASVLAEDGALVEFEQLLFRIRRA